MPWGLVNILQLLTNLLIINVDAPENTMNFHGQIVAFINFDTVPAGDIFDSIFNFSRPWLNDTESSGDLQTNERLLSASLSDYSDEELPP